MPAKAFQPANNLGYMQYNSISTIITGNNVTSVLPVSWLLPSDHSLFWHLHGCCCLPSGRPQHHFLTLAFALSPLLQSRMHQMLC